MHCPRCQAESPPQARFCPQCGAPLTRACPQCGTVLPGTARFCLQCGAALGGETALPAAVPPQEPLAAALRRLIPAAFAERLIATRGQLQNERRMITILFSDVKGSTALAEHLDPEDLAEIMNGAFEVMIPPIYRHEGTLARLMGDAILAFFGAPIAHENDAERACRAGLEIVAGIRGYAARLAQERGISGFDVRVGINTGLVVVGEVGSDLRVEFTAMGDAVNLAARMEQNAPPGHVLISHDTCRHVRGLFDLAAQPPLAVKGKAEPVQTYLLVRARPRAFRPGTRGIEGIATRLIGRDAELGRLQAAFDAAVAGRQVRAMTVVGEAGVGKSRLLYEFERWLESRPVEMAILRGRAARELAGTPYGVLRDLFQRHCDIRESDGAETVQARLAAGLQPYLDADQAALVGQLVGLDLSHVPAVAGLLGSAMFARLAQAHLLNYLRRLAADRAVVVLLEDLHWADGATLELAAHLAPELAGRPLLLVGLTRPVVDPSAVGSPRPELGGEVVRLHRLSPTDTRALVADLLQKVPDIPPDLGEIIQRSAEGNPFYVEEVCKMLIEDGVIVPGEDRWRVEMGRLQAVRVPPTLTGVLQARLDSLPAAERGLLQRAAVVGREFWDDAVAELSGEGEPAGELAANLAAAQSRELIFPRPRSSFAQTHEYIFKHALLRDVTYETVLLKARRRYHRQVAGWLEAHAGARLAEYTALIAYHYELAREAALAAGWFRRAGSEALRRSAHADSRAAFERALALWPTDDPAGRIRVLLGMGSACEKMADYPPAEEHLAAALELARQIGDLTGAADALRSLSWIAAVHGRYDQAQEFSAEALELARASGDPVALARAQTAATEFIDDYAAAMDSYRQCLEILRQAGDRNSEANCLLNMGIRAYVAWDLGEAAHCYEQGLAIFRQIGHLWGAANCYGNLGTVAARQGDYVTAIHHQRESLAMSRQMGDRESCAIWLLNLGEYTAATGDRAQAGAFYREALGEAWAIGAASIQLHVLGGLADLYLQEGQAPRAAELLGLIDHHAALNAEVEQANGLLRERLRAALPAGELEAALERGGKLDPEAVVAGFLAGEQATPPGEEPV